MNKTTAPLILLKISLKTGFIKTHKHIGIVFLCVQLMQHDLFN